MIARIYPLTSTVTQDIDEFDIADQWTYDLTDYEDISDYLIDSDIVVDQSLESVDAFELEDFSLNLTIKYNSAFWLYIRDFNVINDYGKEFAIRLYNDDGEVFWGVIDKFNTSRSLINQTIELSAKGFYKHFLDTLGHKIVYAPSVAGTTTLSTIMDGYFGFGTNPTTKIVESFEFMHTSSIPAEIDGNHLGFLKLKGMSIKDFFYELQKHFCGYFYVDADKVLRFVWRDYITTATNIDDYILDETYEEGFEDSEYDSVLISARDVEDPVGTIIADITPGWFLLAGHGEDVAIILAITTQEQLDALSDDYNYLDLRQKILYDAETETFINDLDWWLFRASDYSIATTEQVVIGGNDPIDLWGNRDFITSVYSNILGKSFVTNVVCNRLDINIYNTVNVRGSSYSVTNVQKNYTKQSSQLTLKRTI